MKHYVIVEMLKSRGKNAVNGVWPWVHSDSNSGPFINQVDAQTRLNKLRARRGFAGASLAIGVLLIEEE